MDIYMCKYGHKYTYYTHTNVVMDECMYMHMCMYLYMLYIYVSIYAIQMYM